MPEENYSGNDISSIITKIIQNPEFAEMVSGMKGNGESAGDVQREMLENLPGVMSMVSPLVSGKSGGDESEKSGDSGSDNNGDDAKQTMKTVGSPAKPSGKGSGKYDKGKAEKLMYALKPYLSPERCRIIDRCVSLMQLTDVVEAFGGLEGLMGR